MEVAEQQHPDVPDGWEVVAQNAPAAPPPAGPRGSDRTRVDTNTVGVDRDWFKNRIANWASTLPRQYQWIAGTLAAVPAEVGANLVEFLSSPETIATAGAKPALAGLDAAGATAGKATSAAGKAVGAAIDVADPDLVSIVSPRGGAMLKKAQQVRDYVAAKQAATASASAPVAEPVASAPAAPAPVVAAPAPAAPPVPPVAPPSPQSVSGAPSPSVPSPAAAALPDQRALNEAALAVRRQAYQERLKASQVPAQVAETAPAAGNVKLSAAETKAFLDLMKRGMSSPDAMKNVLLQRSLVDTLGTPTPTAAQTRFPKGMRGKQP